MEMDDVVGRVLNALEESGLAKNTFVLFTSDNGKGTYTGAAELEKIRPDAILTLAYEGGHPDHDSCGFLASRIGLATGVTVWEAPLYRRRRSELSLQEFVKPNGTEIYHEPNSAELETMAAPISAKVPYRLASWLIWSAFWLVSSFSLTIPGRSIHQKPPPRERNGRLAESGPTLVPTLTSHW